MIGMRLLFVSAEIYPLAKTGGLADGSTALPQALRELGVDVRLCMAGYPAALEMVKHKIDGPTIDDGIGGQAQLIDARMPDSGLPIWLLRAPALFERDRDPYRDQDGVDWPDNAHRFGHACRVAAAIAAGACDWVPNIVHANDWHFGFLPVLLRSTRYSSVKSVFTIHNLAFQGCFPPETRQTLGLTGLAFTPDELEFYGSVSFLKAGNPICSSCYYRQSQLFPRDTDARIRMRARWASARARPRAERDSQWNRRTTLESRH
jgi:starch synthase